MPVKKVNYITIFMCRIYLQIYFVHENNVFFMFVVGRGLPLLFVYLSKIADSQRSVKQQLNRGWLLDRGSLEISIWCRRLLPEKKKDHELPHSS